jgi:hypothetical protein
LGIKFIDQSNTKSLIKSVLFPGGSLQSVSPLHFRARKPTVVIISHRHWPSLLALTVFSMGEVPQQLIYCQNSSPARASARRWHLGWSVSKWGGSLADNAIEETDRL